MASTTNSDKRADPDKLDLDPHYLWIAVLPVVVFLAGEQFLALFGLPTVEVPFDPRAFSAAAEAGARYVFFAMFLLFAAVCISVIWVFAFDVKATFDSRAAYALYGLVAAFAAVVVIFIVLGSSADSPKTYWFASSDVYDHMLAQGTIARCRNTGSDWDATLKIQIESCDDRIALKLVFVWILKAANLFTAVAAGCAIAGGISCLGIPKGHTAQKALPAKFVQQQTQRLQQYLYSGAALMVCGMLLVMSWLHWPDFYFSGQSNSPHAALVNGLTLYFGVNYSLIVFAYYAPVALILSKRESGSAKAAKAKAGTSATADEDKSSDQGVPATFRVVFALLSPFLTGLLGTLVNMLSSGLSGQ